MTTPATNVLGSIVLGLQAIDTVDNSVLFNRMVTGLQESGMHDASLTSNFNLNSAGTDVVIISPPVSGFYIRNLSDTAAVTIKLTPTGGIQITWAVLQPMSAIMYFAPMSLSTIDPFASGIIANTDTSDTPIEFAWWG